MDRWTGKIALVTGASAGIGEAIARAFVGAGLQVVGLARRVERVQELADGLKGARGKLHPVKCDLRDEQSIIDAFEWIKKELGGIDVLVNNAGVGESSTIFDGPTEHFRKILDVNVLAVAICTREGIKSMRSRVGEGHLVFISSILAYNAVGAPYSTSLYPASKYALRGFIENVKEEIAIAGDNIRTTSIIPGLVKTDIFATTSLTNAVFDNIPYAQPEDIVAAVLFALSARPNIRVAIKVIDTANVREPYVLKNLTREAKLLAKLQHPSIVCLYETIRCRSSYYLVTELATGGDLYAHIKSQPNGHLDEETAKLYARQLVSALEHIHLQGIVHRDLKMENIMLRDSRKKHIKIIDFGLSNWYSGNEQQTHCGSPEYAAPELFHEGRKYGPEVDIWSLGVILYGMMAGQLPFLSPRNDRITVKEWRDKLMSQISRGMTVTQERKIAATSSGYKDLVKHLLQLQPHKRMPMWQICRHPWINCRDKTAADCPVCPSNGNLDSAQELKAISEEISAATKLDPTTVQKELRRYGDITGMFNIIRHRMRGNGSADVFERSSISSRRPGIGRFLPSESTPTSPIAPNSSSNPVRRALTIGKSRSKTLTLEIGDRGAIDTSKETKRSSSSGNSPRLTCASRNLNPVQTWSRQTEQNSEQTKRGLAVGRQSIECSGSSSGSNSSAVPVRPMTQPQLLRSTLARRLSTSLSKMSKDSLGRPSCAGDSFVTRDTSYEGLERSIDNKNNFHRQQRHSTPSASQIYRTRSIPKSVVPVVTVRSAAERRERQKIRPQSLEITSELLERAKSFSRPRTSVNERLNQ